MRRDGALRKRGRERARARVRKTWSEPKRHRCSVTGWKNERRPRVRACACASAMRQSFGAAAKINSDSTIGRQPDCGVRRSALGGVWSVQCWGRCHQPPVRPSSAIAMATSPSPAHRRWSLVGSSLACACVVRCRVAAFHSLAPAARTARPSRRPASAGTGADMNSSNGPGDKTMSDAGSWNCASMAAARAVWPLLGPAAAISCGHGNRSDANHSRSHARRCAVPAAHRCSAALPNNHDHGRSAPVSLAKTDGARRNAC